MGRARKCLVWLCTAAAVCHAILLHAEDEVIKPTDIELLRNVEFGKGGGRPLHMHIARPSRSSGKLLPAIIYIYGGGWRTGSHDLGIGFITFLARHGYFAASIEYRLSDEAKFPAQIEDCKCAVRYLRAKNAEYHIDPERIGVMGESAGGHLAALLGTSGGVPELEGTGGWAGFSSRVGAVCDWYGPVDFLKKDEKSSAESERLIKSYVAALFGGMPQDKQELARSASPITYITPDDPPFLIMHGGKDPLVSVAQSEEFCQALKNAGVDVTLNILPDAGHGTGEFYTGENLSLVIRFFDGKIHNAAPVTLEAK